MKIIKPILLFLVSTAIAKTFIATLYLAVLYIHPRLWNDLLSLLGLYLTPIVMILGCWFVAELNMRFLCKPLGELITLIAAIIAGSISFVEYFILIIGTSKSDTPDDDMISILWTLNIPIFFSYVGLMLILRSQKFR